MGYEYDRWPRYVPVAERRQKAAKELGKLAKKGEAVQPVVIEGRTIARTFWGKAWCENLEGYSDFANRLPRGRTYVRNGSVCHLAIEKGIIRARVSGTSLYTVTIGIKPLAAGSWEEIRKRCAGKITSLLELLSGKLAGGVMEIVTDRKSGLFPKPEEITLDCSCPDWATMCKHVAAVLYGVGARLDEKPELLFLLRGVNHLELVTESLKDAVSSSLEGGSGRRLAGGDLSDVFGVDLEEDLPASFVPSASPVPSVSPVTRVPGPGAVVPKPSRPASERPEAFPGKITGAQVRMLRERLDLTILKFAALLGVSGATISNWEKNGGILNLQDRSRQALEKAWNKSRKPGRKRAGKP